MLYSVSPCGVANNGWSSAIAWKKSFKSDCWRKAWKLQKWPTTFHTQRKDFKTVKVERSFFLLIVLFNSIWTSFRILIHKERVFAIFVYECWTNWIAHIWKQFLFFLHETSRDSSLWNIRINLTEGLRHS